MKTRLTLVLLIVSIISFGQQSEIVTTGPEKGSLVIVGGGRWNQDVLEKFMELAGGNDAIIVVVPTAGGGKSYDNDYRGAEIFREAGAKKVTVLHTIDRSEADTDAFNAPLKEATGVWFTGGRQWRLVDSYKNTKSEIMFREVLNRGGVIGGSSAGATIQGSYLARGDTKNNQIMMGDHEEGFGYVSNIAIDQHVIARNRHFDMFNILEKKPELLGISIDEGTGVVVQGDNFEVIGASYVIIYDGNFWSREGSELKMLPNQQLFYFLKSGDKYNLRKRKIISND
jgi:cyanophycinase